MCHVIHEHVITDMSTARGGLARLVRSASVARHFVRAKACAAPRCGAVRFLSSGVDVVPAAAPGVAAAAADGKSAPLGATQEMRPREVRARAPHDERVCHTL